MVPPGSMSMRFEDMFAVSETNAIGFVTRVWLVEFRMDCKMGV